MTSKKHLLDENLEDAFLLRLCNMQKLYIPLKTNMQKLHVFIFDKERQKVIGVVS